jgi:hypothetical protein
LWGLDQIQKKQSETRNKSSRGVAKKSVFQRSSHQFGIVAAVENNKTNFKPLTSFLLLMWFKFRTLQPGKFA